MAKFGQRNERSAKLTIHQVEEMRRLYAESSCSQGQLARDFGISIGQVGRIVRGEAWQSLGPPMPTKQEIELSARRAFEYQQQIRNESPAERMVREAAENVAKSPDAMVTDLSKEPEVVQRRAEALGVAAKRPPAYPDEEIEGNA
jgi:hypothetical protein